MAKTLVCVLALAAGLTYAEEKLGDVTDGSRSTFVHLIPLLAEPMPGKEPDQIHPEDEPVLPFSTKQTCGACHSYDKITAGWHFNAIDPNVAVGRRGQPWIFADPTIAVAIPLSYRAWPGVFRPEQVGMTPAVFLQYFGRQMPGGGIGEMVDKTENPDELLRADVTGQLEINCLACHDAHPGQDMGGASGYAIQIIRGNYRWAATASCEFAYVAGSTKGLTSYDFRAPFVSSDTKARPPTVTYRREVFSHNDWVFFDIKREAPKQRCYFCHSNVDVRDGKTEKWISDEDVHLAAGLSCVDCHRNGLEHNITRGYASEPCDSTNPLAARSSCQGCHSGKDSAAPVVGRSAAPVPTHPGIPPTHFDKLSCTACHSGPWPSAETVRTKTARAHAIGIAGASKSGDILPHLLYPVLAKGQDGKIAAHKLFWPAYWGTMTADSVSPLPVDVARSAASKVISRQALSKTGDWPALKEEDIAKILASLVPEVVAPAKAVYVAGGKVYSLDDSGKLASAEHEAAGPYLWPIAHDVRPAAQSLGVRRCEDCHSTDSGFFFGRVAVDTPVESVRGSIEMVRLQQLNRLYTKLFAFSFVFRPWLKVVTLVSCVIIAGVLLLFALKALAFVAKVLTGEDK